jgi:hypothetical protein
MAQDHLPHPWKVMWGGTMPVPFYRSPRPQDVHTRPRLVHVSPDIRGWVLPSAPPPRRRRRGRPEGTGIFRDAAQFKTTMIRLIRRLHKRDMSPSQSNIGLLLAEEVDITDSEAGARLIRRCCQRWHLWWRDIVKEAGQPGKSS